MILLPTAMYLMKMMQVNITSLLLLRKTPPLKKKSVLWIFPTNLLLQKQKDNGLESYIHSKGAR